MIVITLISSYTIYSIIKHLRTPRAPDNLHVYAGTCLFIVGIIFLIFGILINFRIKDYFYDFYDENTCLLWTATYCLSVPIIVRGLLDLGRYITPDFDKWIRRNSMFYTPLFYIFGDIIPLCF